MLNNIHTKQYFTTIHLFLSWDVKVLQITDYKLSIMNNITKSFDIRIIILSILST